MDQSLFTQIKLLYDMVRKVVPFDRLAALDAVYAVIRAALTSFSSSSVSEELSASIAAVPEGDRLEHALSLLCVDAPEGEVAIARFNLDREGLMKIIGPLLLKWLAGSLLA